MAEQAGAQQIARSGSKVRRPLPDRLSGRTLYVVRNTRNQVAVIELAPSLQSGEYVRDIVSPEFNIPTTVAEFGHSLYPVNARFGDPISGTEYQVVRVSK